jgi:hypothetical protein
MMVLIMIIKQNSNKKVISFNKIFDKFKERLECLVYKLLLLYAMLSFNFFTLATSNLNLFFLS